MGDYDVLYGWGEEEVLKEPEENKRTKRDACSMKGDWGLFKRPAGGE